MASAIIGFSSSSVTAGDYPVYEGFNKQAMAGEAFTGLPGKGKTLAFANIVNGSPFCDLFTRRSQIWLNSVAGPRRNLAQVQHGMRSVAGVQR